MKGYAKLISIVMGCVVLAALFVVCICSCDSASSAPPVPGWYDDNVVIAHALGTIDGRTETNSLEALCYSYDRGFKVFETDICLTSDGYLALRHDFAADSYFTFEQDMDDTPIMSKEEFLSTPIKGIYTPILLDDLIAFMNEHSDVYIVTDSKSTDKETVIKQFAKLKETVDRIGNSGLYDRIIVQLYNYDMLDWVKEVYDFKNYILTLYQMKNVNYNKVGKYCKEQGIRVVTMPQENCSAEISKKLHSYGVKVYTHTVNRIRTVDSLNTYHGVDGFYTDYVSPKDLEKYGFERKQAEM